MHNIKEIQPYLGRVLCLGCPGGERYPLLGLVAICCRRRFPGACVGIIESLLYYARAVDNKLLVGRSDIGAQQASATQRTNEAIDQILDYCATYPADGIFYRSSDMVLCACII